MPRAFSAGLLHSLLEPGVHGFVSHHVEDFEFPPVELLEIAQAVQIPLSDNTPIYLVYQPSSQFCIVW